MFRKLTCCFLVATLVLAVGMVACSAAGTAKTYTLYIVNKNGDAGSDSVSFVFDGKFMTADNSQWKPPVATYDPKKNMLTITVSAVPCNDQDISSDIADFYCDNVGFKGDDEQIVQTSFNNPSTSYFSLNQAPDFLDLAFTGKLVVNGVAYPIVLGANKKLDGDRWWIGMSDPKTAINGGVSGIWAISFGTLVKYVVAETINGNQLVAGFSAKDTVVFVIY